MLSLSLFYALILSINCSNSSLRKIYDVHLLLLLLLLLHFPIYRDSLYLLSTIFLLRQYRLLFFK